MKDERLYIVGIGPVIERLASGGPVIRLLISEERIRKSSPAIGRVLKEATSRSIDYETMDRRQLDKMIPGENHQGVLLIAPPFEYADIDDVLAKKVEGPGLVLALDSVTDPHNLGATVRSAYLLGVSALVIPRDRAASVTSVTIKSSAGATESLPICQVTNLSRTLSDLKEQGYWNAAIAATATSTPIWSADASGPLCLVMGSEGQGIRTNVMKQCDYHWDLPMIGEGVGSFNVSVAASLALYEVARQRNKN